MSTTFAEPYARTQPILKRKFVDIGKRGLFTINCLQSKNIQIVGMFSLKLLWVGLWVSAQTHNLTHTAKCVERSREEESAGERSARQSPWPG